MKLHTLIENAEPEILEEITRGQYDDIVASKSDYPPEIRKLLRSYDSLNKDWSAALLVLRSHKLMNELRRARKHLSSGEPRDTYIPKSMKRLVK